MLTTPPPPARIYLQGGRLIGDPVEAMDALQKLQAMQAASQSLNDVYTAALRCGQLHTEAGMALPEPIRRLIDAPPTVEPEAKAPNRPSPGPAHRPISAPYGSPADPAWISIPPSRAVPQTVVPAVLDEAGRSMPLQQIVDRLRQLGVPFREGSLSNVGTRLKAAGVIAFTDAGWTLADDAVAILRDGRLWGPPSLFQPQELAAHRREAIAVALRTYGRLGRAEIIDVLKRSTWVKAPMNVHLVKADLDAMESAGIARQNPQDWTWELAKQENGQPKLKLA
jgi:hypothetical protein